MNLSSTENTFLSIPKYEFHCHLNGSFHDNSVRKYIQNDVINEINQNLTSDKFFRVLKHFNTILINEFDSLSEILEEIIIHNKNQNCIYLEIRDSPRIGKTLIIEKYITKTYEILKDLQMKHKEIILQFIISLHRASDFYDKNIEIVNYLKQMPSQYKDFISCIDFCGDQKSQKLPFSNYYNMFTELQNSGFKLTFHCFEYENDECFDDILRLKPFRISQCFNLNDKEKLEALIKSKIPLEICPTAAEIFTGKNIESFDNYKYLIRENHPIILGSDSTYLMNTSILEEYTKFSKFFNGKVDDLQKYVKINSKNSIISDSFDQQMNNDSFI